MTYTLDTNILIGLSRQYPRDIFGSLWDSLGSSIIRGGVCICPVVLEELSRGGDDLVDWAKNLPGFVCEMTDDEWTTAGDISTRYPGWVRERKNAADPFVVAHAVHERSVIVTQEKRRGAGVTERNMGIPNAADDYGVECIDFLDFLRQLGIRL